MFFKTDHLCPQSMAKDTAQGQLTYFNVRIPRLDNESRRIPIGVNFYEVDLPCDRKFDVYVNAVNKMGSSLNASVVHIPAFQEGERFSHINFIMKK